MGFEVLCQFYKRIEVSIEFEVPLILPRVTLGNLISPVSMCKKPYWRSCSASVVFPELCGPVIKIMDNYYPNLSFWSEYHRAKSFIAVPQ